MSKNLGNKAKSGLGWDVAGTFLKQISVLVVTIILARLLTPEEFGVVGMAMVFISLSQVFIDVGLSQGVIQSKTNNQVVYSTIFYINIIAGIAIGLVGFLAAPFVADFFEKPEVLNVLRWLCLMPFISSLGNMHTTLYTKELNFKILTYRIVISTVVGGVVGIVMAYLNYGVYALVGQQLTTISLSVLFLWIRSNWTPTLEFSYSQIKGILNFSMYIFFDNLLRRFFQKIDTLFIGKYFSAAALGYYSRAESLNAQIDQYTSSSLMKVLFPAFSKIQDDSDRFEKAYFKLFNLAAFLGIFSGGVMFFLSENIILLLLGDKWIPSIIIFQILVFRLIISPFGGIMGKSLLAKGFSKEKFKVSQVQRLILLSPIIVGFYYGLTEFTVMLVIAHGIGFLINVWVVNKLLKISLRKQLLTFVKPLLPFIVLLIPFYYFNLQEHSLYFFVIFVIIQILYAYTLKLEGFLLIKNMILSTVSKLKKR